MAGRTVRIESPCSLHVGNRRLSVRFRDEARPDVAIPLADIWVLILECQQVMVSVAALAALNAAGIGVMTCDARHMPSGLTLPIGAHARHAAIVENQLAISKPMQKRLWQAVVKAKISNQARCLKFLGLNARGLDAYAEAVKSGDPDNREAAAAREYFSLLDDEGTRREGEHAAALDYGYAVLRAGIARELVSGGWLVSRGIHHKSTLNAFNLADDLIEPFRPCVDLVVFGQGVSGELTSQKKHALAAVFEQPVGMQGRRLMVQTAISEMVDSFKQAIVAGDHELLSLPVLLDFRGGDRWSRS